jgi:hypothetical protein
MSEQYSDIRMRQRLSNYQRALTLLSDAVTLRSQRARSPLEQQGLIKAFAFTQELALNVLKDFFEHQGNTNHLKGLVLAIT